MRKKKQTGVKTNVPTAQKMHHNTTAMPEVEASRTLSQEEWNVMKPYKSFAVGSEFERFFVGNYGIIVPAGSETLVPDLHEHWVGKIKEIRSDPMDNSEVWAKVQWLWSAEDIGEQRKRFNSNLYGKMERFLSNMYDFVHAQCFQDIASVVFYMESNIIQPFITDETFYYRSIYDYEKNRLEKVSTTCLCGAHYNPDEQHKESIMHFCPRASCMRSYHTYCLQKANWVDNNWESKGTRPEATSSPTVPRCLQLEGTLPHTPIEETRAPIGSETSVSLTVNATLTQKPLRKRMDSVAASQNTAADFDTYSQIPPTLLALARSPMVKGAGATLPRDIGIVTGNITVVARARRLVAYLIENEEFAQDNWEESIGLPEEGSGNNVSEWVVEDEGLLCPRCGGAI